MIPSIFNYTYESMGSRLQYTTDPSTFSQVHSNLWMGGWPPPDFRIGKYFDCLVLCAMEYQIPDCFHGIEVASAVLNDDGSAMTRNEAIAAVIAAKKVISWLEKDLRVLVTCFAGRNRSGLVCALSLCRGPAGMSSRDAISTIRTARGDSALQNQWFLNLITKFDLYKGT